MSFATFAGLDWCMGLPVRDLGEIIRDVVDVQKKGGGKHKHGK